MPELVYSAPEVQQVHQSVPVHATPTGRAVAFYLLSSGIDVRDQDASPRAEGLGFLVSVLEGVYGPPATFGTDLVARYAIADPNPLALYLRGMAHSQENPRAMMQLTDADAAQAAEDIAFCASRWITLSHITNTLITERITTARQERPQTE